MDKQTALVLCLLYTLMFVFSLYIWTQSRNKSARDNPAVVKRRFISVFLTILVSGILTLYFGVSFDEFGVPLSDPLRAVWGTIVGLLLTAILFLGPVVLDFLTWNKDKVPDFTNILIIRNLIVGPISEEIVFRGFILAVLVKGGFSTTIAYLLSIIFFVAAHGHHIYHASMIEVAFILFQTTIFGALSAFLFFRTETIFAPLISHAFCNFMGFPMLDTTHPNVRNKKHLVMMCYIIGLVAFLRLMFPLTDYTLIRSI